MTTPYALAGTAGYEDLDVDGVLLQRDPGWGDHDQCEFCGLVDRICTVRIYGQPASRIPFPLELAECCRTCAPGLIDRALSEQAEWSRAPITVEVATPAAEVAA